MQNVVAAPLASTVRFASADRHVHHNEYSKAELQ